MSANAAKQALPEAVKALAEQKREEVEPIRKGKMREQK